MVEFDSPAVSALCRGHDVSVGHKTFTMHDGRLFGVESSAPRVGGGRVFTRVTLTVGAFLRLFEEAPESGVTIHAVADESQCELALAS